MFKVGDKIKIKEEYKQKTYLSDDKRLEDTATVLEINRLRIEQFGENFRIQWDGDGLISEWRSRGFELVEPAIEPTTNSMYA